MKKLKRFLMGMGVFLTGTLCTNVFGQYQLPNPGFEEGKDNNGEPIGWHGPATANASSMNKSGLKKVSFTLETEEDNTYAKIVSGYFSLLLKAYVNGAITTGQIVSLGTNPKDASKNYNLSNPESEYKQAFSGRPDTLKIKVKYTAAGEMQGTSTASYTEEEKVKLARISTIIHGNSTYQDPESGTFTDILAKAQLNFPEYPDWTTLSIPFEYVDESVEEAYVLVTATTNHTPGVGSQNGDTLCLDDFEFVYNSRLSTLTYGGTAIPGFARDNYATLDMSAFEYDESKLVYATDGAGATVTPSYDEAAALLTLTVEGNDISVNPENRHVYTVQFKVPVDVVTPITGSYANSLSVNVAGTLSPILSQDISLTAGIKNGTVNLSIKDFHFGGLKVGDINMIDIPVTLEEGKYILEKGTQNVYLAGLEAAFPVELAAASVNSQKELTAALSIAVSPEMTVTVNVYPFTVTGSADLKVTGHVSGQASEVLLIDTGQTYTSVDLSGASLDQEVTYEKLKKNIKNAENLLIYVPANSTITGNNVIVGNKAEKLVLTDKAAFNAPKAFTAQAISYTRNCFTDGRWESIILPFNVEKVVSGNTTLTYSLEKYTGREDSKLVFEEETAWTANTPYIFSLGRTTESAEETKTCEFIGSGDIAVTEPVYGTTDLKGGYNEIIFQTEGEAYLFNEEESKWVACEANAALLPFRAYALGEDLTEPEYAMQHKLIADVTQITGSYPISLSAKLGENLAPIRSQDISLTAGSKNGTVNLSIKNFEFNGLKVGDIYMTDIPAFLEEGKYILEKCTQKMTVTGLSQEISVEVIAASVNMQKEFTATLSVTVFSDLAITVNVYPFTVTGSADLKVTGHVSGQASEVLLVDTEQSYTSVDLSEANIDEDVSYEKLMKNIKNSKNLLIYVPTNSTLTGNNVVVGDKAENIILTDKAAFNAPKAFTAQAITYTRECFTDGRWESIILPFNVEKVVRNIPLVYELEKHTGRENNEFIFEKETAWTANTPYLFRLDPAMMIDNQPQVCEFIGSGNIAATEPVYGTTDLKGSYQLVTFQTDGEAYRFNPEGTKLLANTTNTRILPFRAYALGEDLTEPEYTVQHKSEGIDKLTSDMDAIYAEGNTLIVKASQAQLVVVANVAGQTIRTINVQEGTTVINGLASGFYIINGHKVMVE